MNKEKAIGYFLGVTLGALLLGAAYLWYVRLFTSWPLSYWQCSLIALVMFPLALKNKPFQSVASLVFALAVIAQCLVWFGVLHRPLFP